MGTLFAAWVVNSADMTTPVPEVTTEDASGRLLSLPNVEKCSRRKFNFFNVSMKVELPVDVYLIAMNCIFEVKYSVRRLIESLWANIKVITLTE